MHDLTIKLFLFVYVQYILFLFLHIAIYFRVLFSVFYCSFFESRTVKNINIIIFQPGLPAPALRSSWRRS